MSERDIIAKVGGPLPTLLFAAADAAAATAAAAAASAAAATAAAAAACACCCCCHRLCCCLRCCCRCCRLVLPAPAVDPASHPCVYRPLFCRRTGWMRWPSSTPTSRCVAHGGMSGNGPTCCGGPRGHSSDAHTACTLRGGERWGTGALSYVRPARLPQVHYIVDKAESTNWKGSTGYITKEVGGWALAACAALVLVCLRMGKVRGRWGGMAAQGSGGHAELPACLRARNGPARVGGRCSCARVHAHTRGNAVELMGLASVG